MIEIREEIEYNQGTDIMEDMLQVRRDWVTDEKAHTGKIPEDIKPFYDRFNTKDSNNPEEALAQKAADEEEASKKKKKVDKKAKKVAKSKKNKGDDEDDSKQAIKLGTSEIVTKFDDFYEEWKVEWDQKDETHNQE